MQTPRVWQCQVLTTRGVCWSSGESLAEISRERVPAAGSQPNVTPATYQSQWVGSTANFEFPPHFLFSPQKGHGPPAVFRPQWSSAVESQSDDAVFRTGGSGRVAREHVMSAQGFREGQLSIPNVSRTILVDT